MCEDKCGFVCGFRWFEQAEGNGGQKVNAQGRYPDGNYPYRVVGASGAQHWLLKIVVLGKRRYMGLGNVSLVSLGASQSLTSGKLNRSVEG